MKLNQLKPQPGSKKKRMRVGRGIGSGKGKTSGRGGKGQTARTGVAIAGFEGGQMPLFRRLPKVGFKKYARKTYAEVNLGRLQQAVDAKKLDAAKPVDAEALIKAGVISHKRDGVRLLAKGEIKAKLTLSVAGASAAAIAAVEKVGGKVNIQEKRPVYRKKKAE